jgi:DNA-binding transcriptional ArsR family regulator
VPYGLPHRNPGAAVLRSLGMADSVRKAMRVLDLFSVERPDWGPSEVAGELGIAKSTAHGLLKELARAGLTERLPEGRYRLGWRTVGLARTMLATDRLRDAAGPLVKQLSRRYGETVHIATRAGDEAVYVASARPAGGVAPTRITAGSPLWRVLFGQERERLEDDGYVVANAPALRCAVAPVDSASALALCARRERFDEEYGRAVAGVAGRLTRLVRA